MFSGVFLSPRTAGTGLGIGRDQDLWWFWPPEYLSGMGQSAGQRVFTRREEDSFTEAVFL